MTQEKADRIFAGELGQQLSVIYVTTDDAVFIRREEALNHCRNVLKISEDECSITEWYPQD
jgi:hypothetical protein